jgi:1,4-alpha-glucan branching enzyme
MRARRVCLASNRLFFPVAADRHQKESGSMDIEATGTDKNHAGGRTAGAQNGKEMMVNKHNRGAVSGRKAGSSARGNNGDDGIRPAPSTRDSAGVARDSRAPAPAKTKAAAKSNSAPRASNRGLKVQSTTAPKSEGSKAAATNTAAAKTAAPKPTVPRTTAPPSAGPKTIGRRAAISKSVRIPTPEELAAEAVARALRGPGRAAPTASAALAAVEAPAASKEPAALEASPSPMASHPPDRTEVATQIPSRPSSPDYPPFFGELDLYLTGEGKHFRLWEKMGAHPLTVDGVAGVVFAVWAPNADGVSVVGAFNEWDGRRHPMRGLGDSGIWYAFVPGVAVGTLYKYELRTREGHLRIKSDPYAFFAEVRPASASIVWDVDAYAWGDQGWMETRRHQDLRHQPMNVYEMHLASWMRAPEDNDRWLNYRELAPRLVDHLRRYNFTHVELLPVAEHLLDQSWGYQVTGYFAPTSRHGTPDDFKYLVDLLHQNGIGIIIDWVPAHFPKDESGLRWFDGTALYEHADPRQGEHRDWGTLIFNYGRHEVRNFLLANALFWLDVYHIDGLRVDAVASMLYLDYSREEGDWLPNRYGGRENIEAIDFIRKMNELVYGEYPGAFTIAEESTDWGGVTMPTYLGGLGFGFKWDMGWMHDTLLYFSKEPVHRAFHHNDLTFAMLYAYTENFVMPLSHDEVVHGKGSLLGKMPGDDWQRFANLRALYAYLYTRPGKKLLFMGAEFAQSWEWRSDNSLDWHLTNYPPHKGIELLLEDLGKLYRSRDALWAWDTEPQGYQWIDCSDAESSVLSYLRRGPSGFVVTALNLTPVPRLGYRIGVPEPGFYREVLNTDSELYGGSNQGNSGGRVANGVPMHGHPWSLNLTLPPLAAVVFELAK